jgi:hypothetical protein
MYQYNLFLAFVLCQWAAAVTVTRHYRTADHGLVTCAPLGVPAVTVDETYGDDATCAVCGPPCQSLQRATNLLERVPPSCPAPTCSRHDQDNQTCVHKTSYDLSVEVLYGPSEPALFCAYILLMGAAHSDHVCWGSGFSICMSVPIYADVFCPAPLGREEARRLVLWNDLTHFVCTLLLAMVVRVAWSRRRSCCAHGGGSQKS